MVWYCGNKKVEPAGSSLISSIDDSEAGECPTPPVEKKSRKSSQTATKTKKNTRCADRYDREVTCVNMALVTLIVLMITSFLTWKYGLKEPQNWEEAQEGFQDIWAVTSDLWTERDIGSFLDVLNGRDNEGYDPLLRQAVPWDNDYIERDNGGLHLTLQNALDDTWQAEFEIAVDDWRESDALQLTTERVTVDNNCNTVDGVIVVCNANFGDTGWVGINERSYRRGFIVSSVVKMNEYYLGDADFGHRRYVMCHEIGHGLGLPHTDENPDNADLGNCLDYTFSPDANMLPGDVNMAKLRGMYLTRIFRRVKEDGIVVETTQLLRR
ncbi:hypothetical protein ACHAW5_008760 [Stephanodiscus triporus]|uniref:Peptidase M10 metallopeptidase domain-containing protein n=1 Tax=Stephanodiscus triporus TaxID=2934178 RepID=A0ABD3PUP0_9STRA